MPFAQPYASLGALGALRPGFDAQDRAPVRALHAHLVPRAMPPGGNPVTENAVAVIAASAAAFAAAPPVPRESVNGDARDSARLDAQQDAPHEPLPAWRRIRTLY